MIALSIVCNTGVHCSACRAFGRDGGAFRESLANAYAMPDEWPTCPHGRPWGYRGNAPPYIPIGLGDLVYAALHRLRVDRLWVWLRGGRRCGCARRRAWLNGDAGRVLVAAMIAPALAWLWSM